MPPSAFNKCQAFKMINCLIDKLQTTSHWVQMVTTRALKELKWETADLLIKMCNLFLRPEDGRIAREATYLFIYLLLRNLGLRSGFQEITDRLA